MVGRGVAQAAAVGCLQEGIESLVARIHEGSSLVFEELLACYRSLCAAPNETGLGHSTDSWPVTEVRSRSRDLCSSFDGIDPPASSPSMASDEA